MQVEELQRRRPVMNAKIWLVGATLAIAATPAFADELSCTSGCSDIFGSLIANDSQVTAVSTISEAEEGATGTSKTITVPAGVVNFSEPGVLPSVGVSDIVSWAPFNVTFSSDANGGPGSNNPEAIVVDFQLFSDADPNTPGTPSDTFRAHVILQNNGTITTTDIVLATIAEGTGEGSVMPVDVAPQTFQLTEVPGLLSDTLTIGTINFDVTSDVNPALLTMQPGAVIPEDSGDRTALTVAAFSDVPEPTSLALLGGSLFGFALLRRRRKAS
jgi:hypothetical protein